MPERTVDATVSPAAIVSWLRQREEAMAALVAELVSVPTENPPGKNYRACVDLLDRSLRHAGLDCGRMATIPGSGDAGSTPECLFATFGAGKRALYFHGHYDVVPAQHPEQFQPVRKDHFLFGRGSSDMKGGIAAMLYAVRALKENGVELHGRVVLSLVPDEETGGARGAAWLARQKILARDAVGMMLPEPTSGVVWNANRGAISLRVRVFGKPAHVALQHRGENAFERMHAVVAKLQQLKRRVEKRATKSNIGAGQSPDSILMLGGVSGGGTNFNVVPAECSFTVDRRINPEEDLDTEKAKLLSVLERCRQDGISLEWEILQEGNSAFSSEAGPLAEALSHGIQLVTRQRPGFEMCPGLLETRFYAAQGVPAFAYGPGLLSVAHGPDEFVDVRRIVDTAAIYALTAMEVLKS
jgi:succinyl-diaminopimelate desuccinylase